MIEKFDEMFLYNKTYLVSNGTIKEPNKNFPSIHPDIELSLQFYTNVKEAEVNIETKAIVFEFETF